MTKRCAVPANPVTHSHAAISNGTLCLLQVRDSAHMIPTYETHDDIRVPRPVER